MTKQLRAAGWVRLLWVKVVLVAPALVVLMLAVSHSSSTQASSPPATPARPTVDSVAHNSVTITWTDPTDSSITGYQIHRRNPAVHDRQEFEVIEDDTASTGTSYTDSGVVPETKYFYRVKARNAHGLSSWSKVAKVTTPADPTPPNEEPAGLPTITGTARVGETLTADTSGISDGNGLTTVQYSYQWIRSDGDTNTTISGATGLTYTLTDDDQGKTVKVTVSFTDDDGYSATLTSNATGSVARPANSSPSGLPTITGTELVGETLTVDTSGISDANGLTNPQFTYQWIRNDGNTDTNITGATGQTHTLTDDDQGKTVKVSVGFTDDDGYTATLTSAATGTVARPANQEPNGLPTITGTALVGETLTANTSGISDGNGLTGVTYTYQWVRSDGATDTEISGATGKTYTLISEDEGESVKVQVSFTDNDGYSHTLTSAAIEIPQAAQRQSSNPPSEPDGQDFPADNTTSGRLVVGNEGVSGNLDSGSDTDAFQIDLESGKRYRIDVVGNGPRDFANGGTYPGELELMVRTLQNTVDTSFVRLNGFGTKTPNNTTINNVVNKAGGPDMGARSEFDVTATATYLVKVISDGSATGTYTVRASEITSEQAFGDFTSQWNSGRVKINDTAAMTGDISDSGESDWYMASFESGKCYSIEVKGEHTNQAHDGGSLTDPKLKMMNFYDYYEKRFYDPDTLAFTGVPADEKTVAYYDETFINPSNFELLNRADKICNMVRPYDQSDSYKLVCNYYCDDNGGPGNNSLIKVRVGTGGAGDYVLGVEGNGSTGTYSVYVKEINCPSS